MKRHTKEPALDEPTRVALHVLEVLIAALVDDPDAAHVEAICSEQSTIFEVRVEKEDIRRVIGRRGRTAEAIRALLTNLGAKAGLRYHLEILEPSGRITLALDM